MNVTERLILDIKTYELAYSEPDDFLMMDLDDMASMNQEH